MKRFRTAQRICDLSARNSLPFLLSLRWRGSLTCCSQLQELQHEHEYQYHHHHHHHHHHHQYQQCRQFHYSPAVSYQQRQKAGKRRGLESSPSSSSGFKAQRSRMQLSRDVARPSRFSDDKDGSSSSSIGDRRRRGGGGEREREKPAVERFGGMNRRVFNPPVRRSRGRRGKESEQFDDAEREEAIDGPHRNTFRNTGRSRRGSNIARASQPSSASGWTRPPDRILKHLNQKAILQPRTVKEREQAEKVIERYETFESIRLLPEVVEAVQKDALGDLSIIEPSPVQRLVIPTLLRDPGFKLPSESPYGSRKASSYLVAAETGSGKTLAYLLPIIDVLKRRENMELEESEKSRIEEANARSNKPLMKNELFVDEEVVNVRDPKQGKPLAIILVPTSELAAQVGNLASKLSHIPKFRARVISRDFSGTVIRNRLFKGPVDILISTPHLLNSITEADPNILSLTSHIVVDEADSLFDRSFSQLTKSIISKAKNLEALICCSATIPKALDTYLERFYPDMKRLATPNLHAVPRHIQLSVIEVERMPYSGNKLLACADVLDQISKDNTEVGFTKRVVVFVNERDDTTQVAEYLNKKGFDAIDVNRDTDRKVIEKFTGPKEVREGEDVFATGRKRLSVLVTTDITSRGIDTKSVKNVVLYDMPHTTIDFIHRVGRTGRMNRRGRAYALVDKNTNMAWVKDIKKAMFLGKSLI